MGTGPLVDPGFEGRLLIPLHNLTSDDYELKAGEGLIWVEFTKVSPMPAWFQNAETHVRYGKYESFPEDKKNRPPEYYFQKASLGNPIRSSISDTLLAAQQSAKRAENSVKKTTRIFYGIGFLSFLALIFGLYGLHSQTLSIVQDATGYVKSESRNVEDFKSKIDERS